MFRPQCTFITAGREYKLSGRLLGAACNRGSERTWQEHNWGNTAQTQVRSRVSLREEKRNSIKMCHVVNNEDFLRA